MKKLTSVFVNSDGQMLNYLAKNRFYELYRQNIVQKKNDMWRFEANGKKAQLLELGFKVYVCYELDADYPKVQAQSEALEEKPKPAKQSKSAKPKKKSNITLIKELQLAKKFIDKKQNVSILNNFRLENVDNKIILTVTDLEASFSTTLDIQTSDGFATTLPAIKLIEILKQCENPKLRHNDNTNNWIDIIDDNKSYKIVGSPLEEFPKIPEFKPDNPIQINAQSLLEALKHVSFACTTEDTRFALNGALFEFKDGKLKIVCTDAHRLAIEYNIKIQSNNDFELQRIIPNAVLYRLIDFINLYQPDYIDFSYFENHVQFQYQDKTIICRYIDGQFPNYDKVMPSDLNKTLTVNVEVLKEAIKSAALLSNERSRCVKLHIAKNKLMVTSDNPELGESGIEIKEFEYVGDGILIGCKADYVLDYLNRLHAHDTVVISMKDKASQLKLESKEFANYINVVMPMNF